MTAADGQESPIDNLVAFRLTSVPQLPRRLPCATARRARSRPSGLFVKGPIDWPWLTAAARLPGKALHVAMTLRLLAGMQAAGPVALSSARLQEAGVDRHAAYRALRNLEQAGLVAVVRHRGRQPRVTILDL